MIVVIITLLQIIYTWDDVMERGVKIKVYIKGIDKEII